MDSSMDLQIWNNATFVDNEEISEDLEASRQSWGSLKSIFDNPKSSFDSVSDKENRCVVLLENNNNNNNQISSVSCSLKSSNTPFKPVNTVGTKSRIECVSKKGFDENLYWNKIRDEKKIDEEIEEIESEILRLKSRLEALRLEKAEPNLKTAEKRRIIVPSKFMGPTQSGKLIEEVSSMGERTKVQRKGVSLGPVEIVSGARRGTSIGPSEIFGATKLKQMGKQDLTTPTQSRRKSCFWKLQDIGEEGRSSSLSPKSRKVGLKTQVTTSRQAVTTISSRKGLKKDDSVFNSVQPKKLFKDGEKLWATTSKKPLKPGRVVASRYSQNPSQASAIKKMSLPENDGDFNQKFDSKRALSVSKGKNRISGTESSRVKKRWEIPSEIVVHGSNTSSWSSVEAEKSPQQATVLLPRIKIARCTKESPRDSGPAKKVVDLIGRKSFFANDVDDEVEVETSVPQALTYDDDEEEEVEKERTCLDSEF
ncbi:hypothetical protein OROGR_007394 [Orobanche gracilis]